MLCHVGDVDDRLRGEQPQRSQHLGPARTRGEEAGGRAALQLGAELLQHRELLGGLRLVRLHPGPRTLQRPFRHGEIGERQLRLHDLDVAHRVDRPLHVRDLGIREAAHHVRDRVRVTDLGEKLVAEPLTARRAPDQPGDIDKLDRGRDDAFRVGHRRDGIYAGVGHGHDAPVGVDRGEGVSGHGSTSTAQRVKQAGFSCVRQPDDTNGECHSRRKSLPSLPGLPGLPSLLHCRRQRR